MLLPLLPIFLNLGKIMEWLSQNWLWLVFGIVMVMMMRRGGHGGCCGGGGHGGDDKRPEAEGSQTKDVVAGSAGHHH